MSSFSKQHQKIILNTITPMWAAHKEGNMPEVQKYIALLNQPQYSHLLAVYQAYNTAEENIMDDDALNDGDKAELTDELHMNSFKIIRNIICW